jgi:orotate phosphoribosyltransferase
MQTYVFTAGDFMESYKEEFITFMVRSKVLTFGDFTTKSGRKTPYFINTGNYKTGSQIGLLGEFYARAVHASLGNGFNVLFGPAYKGIPLAVTAAVALQRLFGHDVLVSYNRKEVKDHGEGGSLIGHKPVPGDRLVIIDDVITAGTSVRESVSILSASAPTFVALAVSVDRKEKGPSGASALDEVSHAYGMKALSIVTIDDIVEFLHNTEIDGKVVLDDAAMSRIREYRKEYGTE